MNMELEIINNLYLELSQVATAKSAKEIRLEDKLELCRVFLAECKGDTLDRISPALKRSAAVLFQSVFDDLNRPSEIEILKRIAAHVPALVYIKAKEEAGFGAEIKTN